MTKPNKNCALYLQDLLRRTAAVKSRGDLYDILRELEGSYIDGTFEAETAADYLERLLYVLEDLEGYCASQNIPVPEECDWSWMANFMVRAVDYER